MKNIFSKFWLMAAAVATLGSCSSEADEPDFAPADEGSFRELTVNVAPLSRTTIEYENADFSHLVWQTGDQVAYVTDLPGDKFRTATVTSNAFTASVPTGATSANKLIVVYPCGNLNGKSLSDAAPAIANPASLNIDNSFDGTRLPMTAVMPVPSGSKVDAEFTVLPAVIRLSLSGVGEESTQTLKSVSLSANEPLSGAWKYSDASGWTFTGTDKKITMDIQAESTLLYDVCSSHKYIYFVVPRAQFSGLSLTVTTDTGSYMFPDGTIDLTSPTRSLYRLDVALGEPDPVKEPQYVKITSVDQISGSTDDKYLIVYEDKNLLFCEFDSGNYHMGVPTTITDHTISPNASEAKKCALTIAHPAADATRFYIKADGIRPAKPYAGVMRTFIGAPGKIAFRAESALSALDYWAVSFDANGNVLFEADTKDDFDNPVSILMGFGWNSNAFCTYKSGDSGMKPLQLYKLVK